MYDRVLRISLFIVALTWLACGGKGTDDSRPHSNGTVPVFDADEMQDVLLQCMSQDSLPGLAFALFNGNGVMYEEGFGFTGLKAGDRVTPHTVFRASSLSKPVFAYLVIKAAQENQIDLQQPLYQYHPLKELSGDPRSKLITGRTVLHHSTGLQNWRGQEALKIDFQPGSAFGYSGEGYMYLQEVFEKVTQQELHETAQQHLFKPLKMDRSSFVWKPEFEKQVALGHNSDNKQVRLWRADQAWAAGSLYTSLHDYSTFLSYLLKEQRAGSAITAAMFRPEIAIKGYDEQLFWGLGVGLEVTSDGPYAWHWGSDDGYKSFFMLAPEQNLGLVFFSNSSNGLNIAEKVVTYVFAGAHPAFAWLIDEYGYKFMND